MYNADDATKLLKADLLYLGHDWSADVRWHSLNSGIAHSFRIENHDDRRRLLSSWAAYPPRDGIDIVLHLF